MSTSSLDQLELQFEELEASADPHAAEQKFSAPWRRKPGSQLTRRWREQDSNPRSLARGTTLFEIAPFDHSGNSVPATEMISARPEVGPIWGGRRRGK
jgi:hypothetical protein